MGSLAPEQILRGVRTVGAAMNDAGVDVDTDAGVEAARRVLGE
jgi:aspartate aminotransferase-like enzyme